MKILSCFNTHTHFSSSKRFVFMAGEEFDKSFETVVNETAKIAESSETNVNFADYKQNVTLVTMGVIEGIVATRKEATQSKIDDLDKQIEKLPKGSPQIKKLESQKQVLVDEKADIEKKDGTLRTSLLAAQQNAFAKIESRFNDANKKREDAAKKFADDFKQSLQAQMIEGKYADQEKMASWDKVTGMMEHADLDYQDGVAMPSFVKKEGGGVVNKGGPSWNEDNVLEATAEMLQNTYVELGPKAAYEKLAALKKEQGKEGINYFTWDKAFGTDKENGGGRGSFRYVLDTMCFDTNRGSKLFGEVVGKMNAANEIFKDEKYAKYFEKYEAAVKEAIDQGKDVPSPTMWAKDNAPEALIKAEDPEKARDTLVSSVLERISSELPLFSKDNDGDRLKAIEWHLRGALSAEPDPTKYDAMVKKVLLDLLGAESGSAVDFKKLARELDYTKIGAGREIFGDVKGKLPAKFLYAQSGLVRGLDYNYGGKQVEIMKDGKPTTVDFVAYYKEYLDGVMKRKGEVGEAINDEYTEHVARQNALLLRYSGKTVPPEELEALEKQHEDAVRIIMQTKVVKPADLWDKVNKEKKPDEPKKEEAPKDEDKDKAKGKEKGKKPAGAGKAADAPKGGSDAAPKKPADAPTGGGKKQDAAPKDLPVAAAGADKKTQAEPGKPPAAPAVQPPAEPEAPVEVVGTVPDAVKTKVIQIVTKIKRLPRPEGGWKPQDAQAAIDAGVKGLPAGLIPIGGAPLTFHTKSMDMDIEVTVDDKGAYQGRIVAASPKVKEQYGLDVPETKPPVKPDTKVADAKDKPTDKPGA